MKKPLLFAIISLFVTLGFQVNAQTSVFNWDVETPHYIQPVDAGSFSISYFDEDGLTPQAASGFPVSSFITLGNLGDSALYAVSWFNPVGVADNWVVYGPISHPNNITSVVSWDHQYSDNLYRDAGYKCWS
jgi:hypothetical protein